MRDILTSPQIEAMLQKRRTYRLRLASLLFVFIIVFIGALAYLSSYRSFTIHTINISGTRIINKESVEDAVRQKLSGRYFHLFARSNRLLYPKNALYKDLRLQFPRIETINIADKGLQTIDISITERAGSFLYCGANIPEVSSQIGENCYFINNDGYIFDKAPYFSGNVYFKYYRDIPSVGDNPLGAQFMDPEIFHSLVRFVDGINAIGFKSNTLVAHTDGLYTLYLDHSPQDTNPVIMFKKGNNLETILDNLSISMAKEEFAKDIHTKYSSLLYIDLRFTNKVLYKFQ